MSLVALFIGLVVGVPSAAYIAWLVNGRAALRQELARIAKAGDPLTTAEMNAWYQPSPNEREITNRWTTALARFGNFTQPFNALADVRQNELPPFGQILVDEPGMQTLLSTVQADIDALHGLAAQPGAAVRYPHDFKDGLAMMLTEVNNMIAADRALQLEFILRARAGDTPGVLQNLTTRLRMAETLASEPLQVALLLRQRYQVRLMRDMYQYVLAQPQLSDEHLQHCLRLLKSIDYQDQLHSVMQGERALTYQACHYRFSSTDQLFAQSNASPLVTTNDPGAVPRPEDCATALHLLTDLNAASKLSPTLFLQAVDKTRAVLADLEARGTIERWRYQQTLLLLPAHINALQRIYKALVYRELLEVALQAQRYKRHHGEMPRDVDALIPQFITALPIDPYDGRPVKIMKSADLLRIYSVGTDAVDNEGESQFPQLEPDIAITIGLSP